MHWINSWGYTTLSSTSGCSCLLPCPTQLPCPPRTEGREEGLSWSHPPWCFKAHWFCLNLLLEEVFQFRNGWQWAKACSKHLTALVTILCTVLHPPELIFPCLPTPWWEPVLKHRHQKLLNLPYFLLHREAHLRECFLRVILFVSLNGKTTR